MTDGKLSRGIGLAGAFCGVVLALLAGNGSTPSVRAAQKEKEYPKPPEEITSIGAAGCQECHNFPKPEAQPLYKQTHSYKFVRLWENLIWENHDLHSQAYKNLDPTSNLIAQKMQANSIKIRGGTYSITKDTSCLACHANVKKPLAQLKPTNWKVKDFDIIDGVGCEMCHGHGSAYRDRHRLPVDVDEPAAGEPIKVVPWRNWPPSVKSEWGLVNLRDPATAATKCASCHVGNKDEGRFVTHEMFAVGHPPLPPLDLMAYAREQPRHWGLASEMPYLVSLAKKDPQQAFDTFHYRDGESLVARRFAESTIGTLAASIALTGQLAAGAKEKNDGLDFAAFDCYSCHHNLKYPSDRQARGYDGPPGRPQFRLAPFALARLVVDHAAGMEKGNDLKPLAAKLDQIQKKLALVFGNKTYGDPELVGKAAEEVKEWCKSAQTKLQPVRYTKEESAKLLAKIVESASREPIADPRMVPASQRAVADPELAQMYVWAAETLIQELKDGPPKAITDLREALKATVVTRLRPNADFSFEQKPTDGVSTLISVDKRLHERMEIFNSYRGETFRAAFKKLGELK